jgi:putative transposase
MIEKFSAKGGSAYGGKNKYKIESARLQNYDYSQNGMYFVTICARESEHFFGEVKNEKMILNDIGKIANKFWQEIPKHFPFVNLDEFVMMPNHIHGIVEINKGTDVCNNNANILGRRVADLSYRGVALPRLEGCQTRDTPETQQCCVSTEDEKKSKTFYKLKPGSLPVIIRSYKSIVAKTVHQNFPNIGFQWQSKFYDHIIRNGVSLNKIREYIQKNPEMWEQDRNNPEDVFM